MSLENPSSIKGEKKYNKLLNNLLSIKGKDQSLFTRVNNVDSFDVTSKFSNKISKEILLQKQFELNLQENDIDNLIQLVKKTNDPKLIIKEYDKYKLKLSNFKKNQLLDEDKFLQVKKDLLSSLIEEKQKEKIRWKQFRRKVLDSNIQDNIWPLHVATFFISIKTPGKELYAPLLLKEVQIEVNENKVQISSEDTWKLNEKLTFILAEAGFVIGNNINPEEIEFNDLVHQLLKQVKKPNLEIDLTKRFVAKKVDEVINKTIDVHPGVVLGLFKPSGGHLRKVMQEIIDKEEIENILNPDPDKNIYRTKIQKAMVANSKDLIRIQNSNFSQDKALISSLIQNTIIWGPPGTGKSQVIANIIANILYANKTAIVMSQKKAALDVLKKRLGKISPFALFILNDNKMDKEEFYKPLKDFVRMVENNVEFFKNEPKEIVNKNDLEFLKTLAETKRQKTYDPSLDFLDYFANDLNLIQNAFELNSNFKYPRRMGKQKNFIHELMEINNLNYERFLFFKKTPLNVKKIAENALKIYDNSNLDPNLVAKKIKLTNQETINNLLKYSSSVHTNRSQELNEQYLTTILSKRILSMIDHWGNNEPEMLEEYKRFSNAVRAARRIPFKFMNDHSVILKKLFPVVISTPETSFINWEKNSFDYAILDESSQIFLEIGLPILYLAKIKILAGDNEQMQPSRWFMTRDEEHQEDEEDIVENADSLLDYAFDKGVYEVMLNQNYRSSSAALMSFSAKQFYNSELEVVDSKNKLFNDSIIVKNVNGKWEDGANLKEIKEVIKTLKEEFNGENSIIVLTFNANQRQLIEKEILEKHLDLSKGIEDELISIRNIENIQGDEADVVIMSVVYDKTTNIGSTYVARQGGKHALNVAVSRAKEKMIVIKSVNALTIKPGKTEDFKVFKDWLEFLDMPADEKKKYSLNLEEKTTFDELLDDFDSPRFKRDVKDFIKENFSEQYRLKIQKNYDVGSKTIDLALVDRYGEFVLGFELDDYSYWNSPRYDNYLNDLSRQEFLKIKGYNVYRITEIDFKVNKAKIKKDINNLLKI